MKIHQKWTLDHNVALIDVWLNTSIDSVKGNNQSADSYWSHITKKFNETTGESRKTDTVKSHWSKITKKVKTFDACYRRAKDIYMSEWSDIDYKNEAHSMYQQEQQKTFNIVYFWEKVKDEAKWNSTMLEQASKKLKINEAGEYATSSGDITNGENVNNLRLMGKKAAEKDKKLKIKEAGEYATSSGDNTNGENVTNNLRLMGKKAAEKEKEKGKTVDSGELLQAILESDARKTAALDRIATARHAQASAIQAQADAIQAQASAIQAQAEAQKVDATLQFIIRDTSHMSEEEKREHQSICNNLKAKFLNF